MSCHTKLKRIDVNFINFKAFLKVRGWASYCSPLFFQDTQWIIFLTLRFKLALTLYLSLKKKVNTLTLLRLGFLRLIFFWRGMNLTLSTFILQEQVSWRLKKVLTSSVFPDVISIFATNKCQKMQQSDENC